MTKERTDTQAAIALEKIVQAFAGRTAPSVMTDSMQLSDAEYAEVRSFEGLRWQDVTFDQIQQCPDAVFWFAPEAFCYYLPGIMSAGLKEKRTDTNAYDSLIGCLNRSPEPNYWDDFFLPRWPLLTAAEVDAVAAWAQWLEIVEPDAYHTNTYERVQDTLTLLKWETEES
ncbi:MAG: hypothetical protein HKN28_03300 [Alphaproteobacteria bacterium]|nr:hypothetical protein [Alphaproteobacteria bacterium]